MKDNLFVCFRSKLNQLGLVSAEAPICDGTASILSDHNNLSTVWYSIIFIYLEPWRMYFKGQRISQCVLPQMRELFCNSADESKKSCLAALSPFSNLWSKVVIDFPKIVALCFLNCEERKNNIEHDILYSQKHPYEIHHHTLKFNRA